MDSARPADALRAYNEAYALEPQPALLYNRGRAHMALEQFPEALQQLLQFREQAPPELRVALLVVGWATTGGGAGKVGRLFDRVIDSVIDKL